MTIPAHIVPRLWSRIDVRSKNECWPWQKHIAQNGYGYFTFSHEGRSRRVVAHRAIAIITGVLKDHKLVVRHLCGNRACCNPDHLAQGTHKENAADRKKAGTHWVPQGSKHYNATLDEEQVRIIKDLLRQGFKQADIAKLAGVSERNISKISRGKGWRHVT